MSTSNIEFVPLKLNQDLQKTLYEELTPSEDYFVIEVYDAPQLMTVPQWLYDNAEYIVRDSTLRERSSYCNRVEYPIYLRIPLRCFTTDIVGGKGWEDYSRQIGRLEQMEGTLGYHEYDEKMSSRASQRYVVNMRFTHPEMKDVEFGVEVRSYGYTILEAII